LRVGKNTYDVSVSHTYFQIFRFHIQECPIRLINDILQRIVLFPVVFEVDVGDSDAEGVVGGLICQILELLDCVVADVIVVLQVSD
jgi:hypothetical protein